MQNTHVTAIRPWMIIELRYAVAVKVYLQIHYSYSSNLEGCDLGEN